jgi:hypothetical protein
MEWLVGAGTLALAVATVILAVQAYHTRVDATQPAVALILDPPRDAPLKPPAFASDQPSAAGAGELFTDRDSNAQLLLVHAPGAVLNDGPRAATIEMLGAAGSTPWDKFEVLDWAADVNEETGDAFREDLSYSPGPVAPLGDLTKVTPRRLGPGRYLLPARSISRLHITLGATVSFWGTASASEPSGSPLALRSVSRVLEVRPAGGGGAVDRIRFDLRAAPLRRNPGGDGWVVGSPVEVHSASGGTTYVMPHPESLVAPPVRSYPFGLRSFKRRPVGHAEGTIPQ